jgi:hypothetical protein
MVGTGRPISGCVLSVFMAFVMELAARLAADAFLTPKNALKRTKSSFASYVTITCGITVRLSRFRCPNYQADQLPHRL